MVEGFPTLSSLVSFLLVRAVRVVLAAQCRTHNLFQTGVHAAKGHNTPQKNDSNLSTLITGYNQFASYLVTQQFVELPDIKIILYLY